MSTLTLEREKEIRDRYLNASNWDRDYADYIRDLLDAVEELIGEIDWLRNEKKSKLSEDLDEFQKNLTQHVLINSENI